MARFIFSMQNILNMKEKLEEQAKNNFAQANRSLQEALLMQKQCENRLEAGKQTLKEAMLENLKVGQIRRREDDVEIFRMYLRQQILVVKQKEKEVEVARDLSWQKKIRIRKIRCRQMKVQEAKLLRY